MAYERKPGDVVIFKNTKRDKDTQPEYRGTYINQNGEECDIGLWVKTSNKDGSKFFAGNLKFEPWKKQQQPAPQQQPQQQQTVDDIRFNDDVPF